MEKQSFDFEACKKRAATWIKNGETFLGKEGVLTPLLKEFLEWRPRIDYQVQIVLKDLGEVEGLVERYGCLALRNDMEVYKSPLR